MNVIKGLLTKDLLQLRSYRKTLIIFIIITLFLFLVTASNLRFSLENLEVSNTKKKFNIKISLVLFKKFTWLFINLDKTKLERLPKRYI